MNVQLSKNKGDFKMLQSILSNLAIILLLHLTMSIVFYFSKIPPRVRSIIVIILMSLSVISMFYLPIRFDNYYVDLRLIPLVFVAYFQGWKVAIPTLIIASVWRFFMGGDGMIPGIIFGMVGPTLLALAFHPRSKLNKNYVEKIFIIIGSWLICDIPIIFIIPNGTEFFLDIAFARLSSFIITAAILYTFIMQDRQRRYLYNELVVLAGEDSLTKLMNKRKFFEVVEKLKCEQKSNQFIAMMDIDHFKRVNDTYGHLVGDQVLVDIAKILVEFESDSVKVARYGGEEFILYIGNSTEEQARSILENLSKKIKSYSFLINSDYIHITVSIGLATIENFDIFYAISKADENLYTAKNKGRNCIVCM